LGKLHYPRSNRNGCEPFKNEDFSNDPLFDDDTDMSPIILVDRGECPFVTKVKNIEKLGVKLAVIVDNNEEATENLIMADDGRGNQIGIPSYMIRKRDGNIIKDTLINNPNKSIYMKAEIEM